MPKTNEELYRQAESELYGEAIAETEREIHDDALGLTPEERNNDRSLEEFDDDLPNDEDEEETETDEVEAAGEDGEDGEGEEPEPERQERQQDERGRVPSRVLRESNESRRVAEAERARLEAENREIRTRLEQLERNRQQPGQQQAPQKPDMFADPEGYEQWLRNDIEQKTSERRINGSFQDAADEHGERFQTAFQTLVASRDPQLVGNIVNSHNPGRTLMAWHDRQVLLSEIGSDPAAYKERVRQELLRDPEVRRQTLSGMRNDALRGDGDGGPRTRTRLPPSLSSATGGASHRGRDPGRSMKSEEAEIAASAWED